VSCGCVAAHGSTTVYRTASEAMACAGFRAERTLSYALRLITEMCRDVTLSTRGLRDREAVRYAAQASRRALELIEEAS
jgi:hypothetical protein